MSSALRIDDHIEVIWSVEVWDREWNTSDNNGSIIFMFEQENVSFSVTCLASVYNQAGKLNQQ